MKTSRLCGWAVIFTATLLLVAYPSHSSEVTYANAMSGPDATMIQPDNMKYEDSPVVISQDWLDERERAIDAREKALKARESALAQREFEGSAIVVSTDWLDERERAVEQKELSLENRENALAIDKAWLDEREMRVTQRERTLDQHENAVAIDSAWLDEREKQVAEKEFDLDRRENALAINQAWLSERETRLAQGTPDLTSQEDMLAFREAWSGGMTGHMEERADILAQETEPGAYTLAVEHGRCYASIHVPAQYRMVAVTKPIEVPKGENLPRLYQTVTEQVKVSDEGTRWEEVLCEEKLTTCRITEIQRSLFRGGYYSGPIDGIAGRKTMAAVNTFQKDFDLTVTNHLTVETVRALDAYF